MYRKRLKNVYDLLEAGNNKKVIQEVDKLLLSSSSSTSSKKTVQQQQHQQQQQQHENVAGYDEQATMIIAKALKSLALIRTGKKSEADKIVDELLDTNTSDENVLNIIMQYCKETHQLSKIVSFYENAVATCQKRPATSAQELEDMQTSLFYAYVRTRDFAKQQQVSLRLFKQSGRMTFCYWNAASYVMMSKEQRRNESPADATKRAMYLTLAEKMLQKAYDDGKMEYNGEYLLFLNILEEKGKYVDALRIVDELDEQAHAATLGYVDFKAKKRMEYLSKLERWSPDLVELCEQHIAHTSQSNMNDWPCYQLYVKAVAEAVKSAESGGDLLIQRAVQFLTGLKSASSEKKYQATYLASVELVAKLLEIDQTKVGFIAFTSFRTC